MSKLYVGLDLSQKSVASCFLLEDGTEPIRRFSFEHNLLGVDKLVAKINSTADKFSADQVLIGMETTGMLWWHMSEALRDHEHIEQLHPEIWEYRSPYMTAE